MNRTVTTYSVISDVDVTEVPGYTTTVTYTPSTVQAMVGNIGTAMLVTVSANFTAGGPLVGTISQCSYLIYIRGKKEELHS